LPIVVLVVLLAINLFIFVIFVVPGYRDRETSGALLQSVRAKIGRFHQYQKTQEAVIDLEKTYLNQQELALLVDRLPAIARRHQLNLPGVSYQNEKQKQGEIRKIFLNFKVSGRYSDVRRFIYEVERLEQFLYIQDMVINSSTKDSDRLELQMDMAAVLH
jgi:Tfp pilus assembly protein PilO